MPASHTYGSSLNSLVNVSKFVPGLAKLQAITKGDSSIKIAVLDGAYDRNNSVFVGSRVKQFDLGMGLVPTEHGTHTTSIIFGQPSSKVQGVAPGCSGLVIPVLDHTLSCSQDALARGIKIAIDNGCAIVNVSAGARTLSGRASSELEAAVSYAAASNSIIIAAAGNDGCPCLHVPGALPSTLVVGAMDGIGNPLPISNWGSNYRYNGILSPGLNIVGAGLKGKNVSLTGTSSAAAIISGIVALLLSLDDLRGKITPRAIADFLLNTSKGCRDETDDECSMLLRGRLDLRSALNQIFNNKGITKMDNNTLIPEEEATNSNNDSFLPVTETFLSQEVDEKTDDSEMNINSASKRSNNSDTKSNLVISASSCGCIPGPKGECSCGSPETSSALVYVIGQLGIDFVSDARLGSLSQRMKGSPNDMVALVTHLKKNPIDAASIYWTLKIEETPVYVLAPVGAYAQFTYDTLIEILHDMQNDACRISVAGTAKEFVQLQSGLTARALIVDPRGLASWSTSELLNSSKKSDGAKVTDAAWNFLERVYYELRNKGLEPEHRALNYSATNAFNARTVFTDAVKMKYELDSIDVERAPIARQNSDAWDVKLSFFDPENTNRARRVYRYTVDVADSMPVTIGDIRIWSER